MLPVGTDWTIKFEGYYPIDTGMEERLRQVCEEIDKIPAAALSIDHEARVVTIDYTQVRDWLDASREFVHISHVGNRLVVKPPWEEYSASGEEIVVEIDAGTAFGSGLHETTRVSLRALEEHLAPGGSVLDFGTGSGILAIAAAKLGAAHVIAFDVDAPSAQVARANVLANGVEEIVEVFRAEDSSFVEPPIDLVVANVAREILIGFSESFARPLKTGGALIAAGVVESDSESAEEAIRKAGFEIEERLLENSWVAFVARKK